YAHHQDEVFLGREISQPRDHSELTAQLIDSEIRKILLACSNRAETILNDNVELLHKTSKVLLERETLDAAELDAVVRGEELPPISNNALNAIKSMSANAGLIFDKVNGQN